MLGSNKGCIVMVQPYFYDKRETKMLNSENIKKLHADSVGFIRKEYNGIMANEDKKFFGKDGFCSVYAHHCGYMDTLKIGSIDLYLNLEHNTYTVSVNNGYHQANWMWHSSEPFSRPRSKALFRHLRKVILYEYNKGSRHLIDSHTDKDAEDSITYLSNVSINYTP